MALIHVATDNNGGVKPVGVGTANAGIPIAGGDGLTASGPANPSFAKGATYNPLGHQQLADATLAASTALPTIPATATVALIQNNGTVAARIRYDGATTDPTTTTGLRIPAGTTLTWDVGQANLLTTRVIREAAGVTLDILYLV